MLLLDENIIESQVQLLRARRLAPRQIGVEVGRQGMKDDEIIPLLHSLRQPTFFTRDLRFYDRDAPHSGYCIVVLSVGQSEVASWVRQVLRHAQFDTQAKRMGNLLFVSQTSIKTKIINVEEEATFNW